MSRFKDFGAPADGIAREKLSFQLYGEEFECVSVLPGKTLLNFAAISSSEDGGESAKAINFFFEKVLVPESYARFEKLTEDTERLVTVETLAEIIEFLIEALTDRPTRGPEPS